MTTNEVTTTSTASELLTPSTARTFEVSAARLEGLNKKFAFFTRKAKKLGVEAPSYVVEGEHVEYQTVEPEFGTGKPMYGWSKVKPVPMHSGAKQPTGAVRMVKHIRLTGVRIVKVEGWTFVATLDHELGEENTVVRSVPGVEGSFAHYISRGACCDHCKSNRRRTSTFVVRHENGTEKQVGSSCLSDFLGHDADHAAALAAFYADVQTAMDLDSGEEGYGSTSASVFDLENFLSFVCASMRQDGWMSRKEAFERGCSSTADRALTVMLASMQR